MSHSSSEGTAVPTEPPKVEDARIAALRLAESLGVTRQVSETYSIGGYSYTNLADAIAQARRISERAGDRT